MRLLWTKSQNRLTISPGRRLLDLTTFLDDAFFGRFAATGRDLRHCCLGVQVIHGDALSSKFARAAEVLARRRTRARGWCLPEPCSGQPDPAQPVVAVVEPPVAAP